jgi:hypothetical protein
MAETGGALPFCGHLEQDHPAMEVDDDTDPRRPTRRPAEPAWPDVLDRSRSPVDAALGTTK